MFRQRSPRKRRPPWRTVLWLERLEDRTLLSTMDGSFAAIGLTSLRNDPTFSKIDGQGVGIAIIDTGVYAQNPDLSPNFVHWFDAVTGQDSSYTDPSAAVAAAVDPLGHGTFVAGVAASSDSSIGVAPDAQIIGIRAVPQPGEQPVNPDPVAAGLQWVIAHHQDYNIRVVNLSIGTDSNVNSVPTTTGTEAALIAQLQGLGVTVVTAAGNDYADFVAPGETALAAASTIAVADTWATAGQFPPQASGSTDGNFLAVEQSSAVDRVAAASQRSTLANMVTAPGQNIISDWNAVGGLLHATQSGTSMSAAMVSGAAALMQQAAYTFGGRYLEPAEILSILRSTADTITDYNVADNGRVPNVNGNIAFNQESPLPETGITLQRINVYKAVQAVEQLVSGARSNTTAGAIPLPSLNGIGGDAMNGTIGQDGSLQVGPNDVHLYQFQTTVPGSIEVDINSILGSAAVDAFLRIFDASGTEVASEDSGPSGTATLTSGQLPPGTYYVGISGSGNTQYNINDGSGAKGSTAEGDYALKIRLNNPDPNGTIAGATVFTGLPVTYHGNIGADGSPSPTNLADVDMYQVIAPDDGIVSITVDGSAYGSQGGQTYLRVFDSSGTQLAATLADAATTFGELTVNVTRGQTIYVAVSDSTNTSYDPNNPYGRAATGSGGFYDLQLDFNNNDNDGVAHNAVSLQGGTSAANIGTDPGPQGPYTVGHDGTKDVDFYYLAPTSSGLAQVQVAGANGFVPALTLWDVSQGDTTGTRAATSVQANAELSFPVSAGQVYFVAVTGKGNEDYVFNEQGSGSGGQTGAYTISWTLDDPSGSPGDPPVLAALSLGSVISGNLGMQGSQVVGSSTPDLYSFVAPATESITISTDTTAEGSANTFLRFFDSSGNELGYNDNAGPYTTESMLVVPVTAGQTYYIGVSGAGADPRSYDALTGQGGTPGSTGPYLLSVTGPPTSSVAPLPAFSGKSFQLSWSGQPSTNGAAIVSYNVYVSDNGGPYTTFLQGTTQTSAAFTGQAGHTYRFYSIAADADGNSSVVPATAQASTTVDPAPPTSTVAALPAISGSTITLSWSGTDANGPGIAKYDVYVSDNGGAFTPFVTGTTQTSTTFQGQNGHVYGFYSVATDALGNRQLVPAQAQAATQVDATPPASQVNALPMRSSASFHVTWSGSDNPGGAGIASYDVYVSDNGGAFTPLATGTAQTSIVFHGQAGHTYGFYSVATDAVGNRQATPAAAQATTSVTLHVYAVAPGGGGAPVVEVYNADTGQLLTTFFAFSPSFTGGVRLAVGYLEGNGTPDIIAAAGPGGGPIISVFNALTGQPLPGRLGGFFAFDPSFTGGLNVAAGDLNSDGYDDIIVGADAGGGPSIGVFNGKDGSQISSFFAFSVNFTGGVRLAVGDLNGDGKNEIIAGAGCGGGPLVSIFDAAGNPLSSFFAFSPNFTAGIYVSAGDVNGDGKDEIIVGAGCGGGPQVGIFAADGTLMQSFVAFDPSFTGGVRVATVISNGRADIVAVPGTGGGPLAVTVDGLTLQQLDAFFAFNPLFAGGLFVAGQ